MTTQTRRKNKIESVIRDVELNRREPAEAINYLDMLQVKIDAITFDHCDTLLAFDVRAQSWMTFYKTPMAVAA